MNTPRHLTEEDRHAVADGTLDSQRATDVAAHLAECESCTADVARLRKLMRRLHAEPVTTSASPATLDDMWPGIRARIERSKVVPLAPANTASTSTVVSDRAATVRRRSLWLTASLAAAAVVFIILERVPRDVAPEDTAVGSGGTPMSVVAESSRVYEQEANTLLNDLELQRSLLRPQTAAAIDHDLHIIDQAIAELKDAIAHDPNNPALRRLLASSYRQKVELLKRAGLSG
ncbi:MAG TPA: zf-HC2 domain-containing protein [Gemmatimonadaceae bacterium]|nr:zf-HC2 domain-containing protein [Gemmatimonadaceae bacterium]